jgi:hypothetical protein
MARILKDVYFAFNAVNLSSFCKNIQLSYEADEKDSTTMTSPASLSFPGFKRWRITAKLNQSFAAGEVDVSLFALIGDEVAKAVEVRVTSAAVAPTNPKFTGTGYLLKYPPIAGSVGDIHETDIEIGPASDLTRATA